MGITVSILTSHQDNDHAQVPCGTQLDKRNRIHLVDFHTTQQNC